MVDRIIEASVRHRAFVLVLALILTAIGIQAVRRTPVDALPDLSDVQVVVWTEYPGQAPQVVEDQVTYPLTTAMLAVPYARDVRGYSFFGFSLVYVIFEDGTDLYWARSRVLEGLNVAQSRLPDAARTQLGPDATGVGWVYEYVLTDFSPRAEQMRQALGDAPVPEPGDTSVALGETVPVYTDAELAALLPDAEGRRYLVDGFDRDGDDRISRPELERALAFRGLDLSQLRSVQDWTLRYDLTSLQGVSEVASAGGFVRQYQIEVDPEKMRAFGVSLRQIRQAVQAANSDVGGRLVEMAETELVVRGRGYIDSIDDLETVPVAVDPNTHTPVLLRQVSRVQLGPDVRRGIIEWNGQGEAVAGIVLLRAGENALEVIDRVEARLHELRKTLPEGVEIHVGYDRSRLIASAIHSLSWKLAEEMLVVALICAVFLLHVRSALVAIVTLPLGILAAFVGMNAIGVNANIMSLAGIAIAIGDMVDASVVMVENLHKHKERDPTRPQVEAVLAASQEVGSALFASLGILTVSFLPILALEAQEGRLFAPLAWTKTLSMAAAAVLSITVVPPLMVWFVRGRIVPERKNPLSRLFIALYRPILGVALRFPKATLAVALAALLSTFWPWSRLGSEFMPPLNEGDLLYMPTTPPGISITKARELLQQTDKLIAQHPDVESVLGKVGRAETATDPAPLTMLETTITLKPGADVAKVIRELDATVRLPGLTNAWTMPIKTRIDMLATGIKTPVGVKLLGDDLETLSRVGQQIEAVLSGVEGTSSVFSERVTGGKFIDIDVRREDAARYGLNVADVQEVVQSAIGGMNVTWTVEGLERYPVNLRYPRELRNSVDQLSRVAVPTPMGHFVPLGQVADIGVTGGPPMIKSENARRTAWVFVDLETSDVGGYVERAKRAVEAGVRLPPGVSLVWSGQYEYMQRASDRLALVVPVVLALIFGFLFLELRRVGESLIVMATLPFALVGGVWWMWWQGFNTSVAVYVGFIALAGLAAETGVILLVYVDEAIRRRPGQLVEAITEGAVDRVRPKLMTVAMNIFGLLAVTAGAGTGVEVMERIAAPMIGGLISSTALTLVILPAVILLWRRSSWAAAQDGG